MELAEFNALPAADAAALVRVWAAIPSWVDGVVEGRPYESVDDLAHVARREAVRWDENDLDTALAHHPRIGERAAGSNAEATASRSEQSAMSDAKVDDARAIADGNARYEERFGRVFLIRAAGRSPADIRAELYRRLTNDTDAEVAEAIRQLTEIALLRLRADVKDEATP